MGKKEDIIIYFLLSQIIFWPASSFETGVLRRFNHLNYFLKQLTKLFASVFQQSIS